MAMKNTRAQRAKTAKARFEEKADKSSGHAGCWLWTSAKQSNGYGVFWLGGGKSVGAHRYAWECANNAEIPSGMIVMHSCNNKGCVNPLHLSIGTHKENSADAANDGLMWSGEKNRGGGKLKADQVKEILTDTSIGCCKAAKKYGVSMQTIKSIRRRRIWKCVSI